MRFHGSIAAAAAILALLVACGRQGPPARDLLLVTFDTTRADRLGAYGHSPADTPNLDALAADGIRYTNAVAPTPITLPSHATILTGLPPGQHGVRDNGLYALAPDRVLVSERLSEAGWHTGAFVASQVLDEEYGLDQGFDRYDAPARERQRGERPAEEVVDAALGWLDTLPPDARFFAWVHFFDPHEPYAVPDGFLTQVSHPYDRQIAYADRELGRLLRGIEARNRGERLSVVVTADHGESLGDHGEESHGVFVYQATLHVPLLIAGAGVAERASVADELVGLVDIAPSLLVLAGVDDALPSVGRALVDSDGRRVEAPASRTLAIESWLPYHAFRWHAFTGVVRDRHKLIVGPRVELYDLSTDPTEQHDLAEERPERVAALQAALEEHTEAHAPGEATRSISIDERASLEALGYVVGSRGADPFAPELPDPRDRIEDVKLISDADRALRRAMRASARRGVQRVDLLEEARSGFAELGRRNPEDPHVAYGLGLAEYGLGHCASAMPWLVRASAHRPDDDAIALAIERCRADPHEAENRTP